MMPNPLVLSSKSYERDVYTNHDNRGNKNIKKGLISRIESL